jgi:hypothetical protein
MCGLSVQVEMKVGDLVRMPKSPSFSEILGVVVNLTNFHRGRIGVVWMDSDGEIEQEPYSFLEVVNESR